MSLLKGRFLNPWKQDCLGVYIGRSSQPPSTDFQSSTQRASASGAAQHCNSERVGQVFKPVGLTIFKARRQAGQAKQASFENGNNKHSKTELSNFNED